jgi:hydrogenase-4 component F
MSALELTLLCPLVGAFILGWVKSPAAGSALNIAIAIAGAAASLALALEVLASGPIGGGQLYVDAFNVYLIALTAMVGSTTAVFSGPYMSHELERGRIGMGRQLRRRSDPSSVRGNGATVR